MGCTSSSMALASDGMEAARKIGDVRQGNRMTRESSGMSATVTSSTDGPSVHEGSSNLSVTSSLIVSLNDVQDNESGEMEPRKMSAVALRRKTSSRKTGSGSSGSHPRSIFVRSQSAKAIQTKSSFGSIPPSDAYSGSRSRTLTSGLNGRSMVEPHSDEPVPNLAKSDVCKFLRFHRLFAALDDPFMEKLAELVQVVTLNPGDFLFHEGDVLDGLFVVHSGTVSKVKEVVHDINSGSRKSLRKGAVLGRLLEPQVANFGVRISSFGSPATVLKVDALALQELSSGPHEPMLRSLLSAVGPCLQQAIF